MMNNGKLQKRPSHLTPNVRVERVTRFDSRDDDVLENWVAPHGSEAAAKNAGDKPRCEWWKDIAIDLAIFLALFAAVIAMFFFIEPRHTGFFCDDRTINYPYRSDMISTGVVFAVGMAIPLITISATEMLTNRHKNSMKTNSQRLRRAVKCFFTYAFGFMIDQFLVEITKSALGHLRPHFIAVCRPKNITPENCAGRFISENEYECTRDGKFRSSVIRDAFRSLPSGHAASSMYCVIYTGMYIQERVKLSTTHLLKPICQALLVALGMFVAVTRVTDYKHHLDDIYVGWAFGVVIAIVTFRCVSLPLLRARTHPPVNHSNSMLTTYSVCSQDSEPVTPQTTAPPLVFSSTLVYSNTDKYSVSTLGTGHIINDPGHHGNAQRI